MTVAGGIQAKPIPLPSGFEGAAATVGVAGVLIDVMVNIGEDGDPYLAFSPQSLSDSDGFSLSDLLAFVLSSQWIADAFPKFLDVTFKSFALEIHFKTGCIMGVAHMDDIATPYPYAGSLTDVYVSIQICTKAGPKVCIHGTLTDPQYQTESGEQGRIEYCFPSWEPAEEGDEFEPPEDAEPILPLEVIGISVLELAGLFTTLVGLGFSLQSITSELMELAETLSVVEAEIGEITETLLTMGENLATIQEAIATAVEQMQAQVSLLEQLSAELRAYEALEGELPEVEDLAQLLGNGVDGDVLTQAMIEANPSYDPVGNPSATEEVVSEMVEEVSEAAVQSDVGIEATATSIAEGAAAAGGDLAAVATGFAEAGVDGAIAGAALGAAFGAGEGALDVGTLIGAMAAAGFAAAGAIAGALAAFPDADPHDVGTAIDQDYGDRKPTLNEMAKQLHDEHVSAAEAVPTLASTYAGTDLPTMVVAMAQAGYGQADVSAALPGSYPQLTAADLVPAMAQPKAYHEQDPQVLVADCAAAACPAEQTAPAVFKQTTCDDTTMCAALAAAGYDLAAVVAGLRAAYPALSWDRIVADCERMIQPPPRAADLAAVMAADGVSCSDAAQALQVGGAVSDEPHLVAALAAGGWDMATVAAAVVEVFPATTATQLAFDLVACYPQSTPPTAEDVLTTTQALQAAGYGRSDAVTALNAIYPGQQAAVDAAVEAVYGPLTPHSPAALAAALAAAGNNVYATAPQVAAAYPSTTPGALGQIYRDVFAGLTPDQLALAEALSGVADQITMQVLQDVLAASFTQIAQAHTVAYPIAPVLAAAQSSAAAGDTPAVTVAAIIQIEPGLSVFACGGALIRTRPQSELALPTFAAALAAGGFVRGDTNDALIDLYAQSTAQDIAAAVDAAYPT